jgi:hydrogenase maturation protease
MEGFMHAEKINLWVIGFGNSHRRDDGIGPQVADELKHIFDAVEGVNMMSLHQLGPELAEDLKDATGVIFIDAEQRRLPGGFSWSRIGPVSGMQRAVHSLTAGELLGFTQYIYNRCPPAWMVSVHGSDFSFGEELTGEAADNAALAAGEIARAIISQLIGKWKDNEKFDIPAILQ